MTLAEPIWLLALLLLPAIAAGAVLAARTRGRKWRALVAERLRERLVVGGGTTRMWISLALLLLGIALLIAALARPQGEFGTAKETIRGRNVIVAIDVSRSMLTPDVRPNRLQHAKALVYELLEAMPNDRIGVIAFAGRPFLVAPLTVDHAAVRETVSQLDEETIPYGGSDLGAATELAIDTLKETGQTNNGLILLSDGEQHDDGVSAAAAAARRSGLFVFAVGIGTERGDLIPDPRQPDGLFRDRYGNEVLSRLEPGSLRRLATETNGRYLSSGAGADIPGLVEDATAGLDEFEIQGNERIVAVEFYQWLLLPAIVSMIASVVVGTRWRSANLAARTTAASIALVGFAAAPDLQAQEIEPAAVQRAELAEKAAAAKGDRRAAFRLAEGNASYRLEDWAAAAAAFSEALLADEPGLQASAHHNLGNTLFQQGWQLLTDETIYPGPDRGPAAFEEGIARRLAEWSRSPAPEGAESETFRLLRDVTVLWVDAATHFQSSLKLQESPEVRGNLELVRHYLGLLHEAMNTQAQELQDQLPPPQQGGQGGGSQPPQQPGEGEGEGSRGEGQQPPESDQQSGEAPEPDQEEQDPGAEDPEENPEDPEAGEEGEEPEDAPAPDDQTETPELDFQPGETAEERARRILEESSDLERSLVPPHRRDPRRPDRDW